MKRILTLLLMTALVFATAVSMFAAFRTESEALGDVLLIYDTKDEIVIDGKKDLGYNLISYNGDKKDGNWVPNTDLEVDGKAYLYACWDTNNLYLYIEVPCNEEHSSYMDNASQHYIFNGHHAMWALLPDNPYQDKYYGDLDDGRYNWSTLYNAAFMYEWSTICDSRTGETVVTDHFKDLTTKSNFKCVCLADGKKDTYEVQIPLKDVVTKDTPDGIPAEEGSLFGFGFRLGLIDTGTEGVNGDGYADDSMWEYRQNVQYSDYFTGSKFPQGLAYAKLAASVTEPKKIKRKYEVFPSAAGQWKNEDNGGATCTVKVSKSVATISGSTEGTWPRAYVEYEAPLLVDPKKAYLVYNFDVDKGAFSIRFNGDDELSEFITDNLDPGSNDILPGHYEGYIPFSAIGEKFGLNDKGYYQINSLDVFSVNGSKTTVTLFNIDPTYEPPKDDTSEDTPEPVSEDQPVSGEPVSDEPVSEDQPVSDEPASEDQPVSDEPASEAPSENPEDKSEPESQAQEPGTSEESTPAASSAGFPWWGWLLIGLGAVAIVCVVLAIVLKKKKA
ncbi:MAG: hypothetical protein ILO68_08475 [Clostridia bacterium]|nr:hypothetical protein [Clostridia bacterium]